MNLAKKIIIAILSLVTATSVTGSVMFAKFYTDAQDAAAKTYKPIAPKEKQKEKEQMVKATKPFSILLMGVDTDTEGRGSKWEGRSDSTMVVTVNPELKQTTIVSLDRDMLVYFQGPEDNEYSTGYEDKLNHTYAYGGTEMTMATVNHLLDIDITYYAAINMDGLCELVDAVGGIDVNNQLGFTISIEETEPDYTEVVLPGEQHINGDQALVYARMRHQDPKGDIGRQARQREVIQKIVEKILSVDGVSHYQQIFDAVSSNVQTDISFDSMVQIAKSYRDAFQNVKQYQLQGDGQTINAVYYQLIPQKVLVDVRNVIHAQLGLAETTLDALQLEVSNGTVVTFESQMGYEGPEFEIDGASPENASVASSSLDA